MGNLPTLLIAGMFGVALGVNIEQVKHASAAPPPCVAFSYLPNIPGYEPDRIHESLVFLDKPVFDRLFAGCEDERGAILAATPGHIVRVMKREPR